MENRTVILAAGDFPRKGGAAWKILAGAKRVVACDSAANAYRRRFRRWPDVIIGDLDSIRLPSSAVPVACSLVRVPEQDTNDLEKAIAYCASRGWKKPVILGATGKREDHSLGNVFRAFTYGLEIVTDRGRFLPICGRVSLPVRKGAAVSVFAPDPKTRMTSKGLEWPLGGVKFRNLHCATLNRTTATRIVIRSDRPAFVYLEK